MKKAVLENLTLLRDIRISSIKDQFVDMGGLVRFALILIAAGLVAVFGIAAAYGVSPSELTRDPAAVLAIPYYVGLLSNWGVMLWSAAAAICLFTAWTLRRRERSVSTWLFASGLITLILALDDMFMLHEDVFPNVFGIHEKVVYAIYILVGGIFILYFLPEFLKRSYLIFASAILFLGISVISDSIGRWLYIPTALEDSIKYMAIVLWLVFFAKTARDELIAAMGQSRFPHRRASKKLE